MHLFNQKYWGKLSRKEWLVNGDRNSRYFHQSMRARKTRSSIVRIKDLSGVWVDSPTQIQKLFVHDFTTRFKSSQQNSINIDIDLPMVVSEEDNFNLIKPIEDLEITEAIFQMDKYKAPGINGFKAAFFQDHWSMIHTDVCQAIKSFFLEGKLLKQVNHTLIALIPKVDNPTTTAQF